MHPAAILIFFCLVLSFTDIGDGSKVKDIKSASWVVSVGVGTVGAGPGKTEFLRSCPGTVIHKRWILTYLECGDTGDELLVLANNVKFDTSTISIGDKDIYNVTESKTHFGNITRIPPIGTVNSLKLLKVDRDLKHLEMQLIPSKSTTGTLAVYGWNRQPELLKEDVTVEKSTDECMENIHKMKPGDLKGFSVNQTMVEEIEKRAESFLCVDLRKKFPCNVEMGSGVVKDGYVYGIADGILGGKEDGAGEAIPIPYDTCEKNGPKADGGADPNFDAFSAVHAQHDWIKSIIPDLPTKPHSYTTGAGQIIEGRGKLLLLLGVLAFFFP